MNRIKRAFSHGTNEIHAGFSQIFSKMKLRSGYSDVRGFFDTNTLVAKVVFLLLMVILVGIVVSAGLRLFNTLATPSRSHGFMIKNKQCRSGITGANCSYYEQNARTAHHWYQSRVQGDVIGGPGGCYDVAPVVRSTDGRYGIEFTWSIWLYIQEIGSTNGGRQHIFSKGGNTVDKTTQMMTPNNAPGLYLAPSKNTLIVVMNTFDMIDEEVEVNDIPLNKWLNVIVRCEGNILDIYVNGVIALRHKLSSVPKQNYGDVWAGQNGGFTGTMVAFILL